MTEAVGKSNKTKKNGFDFYPSACEVSSNPLKTCPHPHYVKAILSLFYDFKGKLV